MRFQADASQCCVKFDAEPIAEGCRLPCADASEAVAKLADTSEAVAKPCGKLYGVSVGPGDPDLLTLKALKVLKRCPVLAVPRTKGERCLALDIASGAVDVSDKEILYLDFLMTADAHEQSLNHRAHAGRLLDVLRSGRDLAMLNLGDASLYSSWSYLAALISQTGIPVETIPGVSSFCACAALMNRSLTEMKEPLHIFPAAHTASLSEALSLGGGKILMKAGRALPSVLAAIKAAGLAEKTALVSDCGLPAERCFAKLEEAETADLDSYFTTILIRP